MEGRNRTILMVLIAVVIVAAVFSSFGMNLIPPQTAKLQPPSPTPSATALPSDGNGRLVRVEVTPQTVQRVIASLTRPELYYREISVSYAGADTPTRSRVWASGGWTRVETSLPGGTVRHALIGPSQVYYWYGNSRNWRSAPADGKSADLDGPHIPTWEDILELEASGITEAGYLDHNGMSCVYLMWKDAESGERRTYYISVEEGSLGLLAEAQLWQGEELLLSMSAGAARQPELSEDTFLLPDGTNPAATPVPAEAAAPA